MEDTIFKGNMVYKNLFMRMKISRGKMQSNVSLTQILLHILHFKKATELLESGFWVEHSGSLRPITSQLVHAPLTAGAPDC